MGDLGGRRAALLGSLQATPPSPTSLRPRRASTSSGKSVPLPFFLFLHVPRPSARGCTPRTAPPRHPPRHATPRTAPRHTPPRHAPRHDATRHVGQPHATHRTTPLHATLRPAIRRAPCHATTRPTPHHRTPCHAMPRHATSSGRASRTAPCRDVTHRVAACHAPRHEDDAPRRSTTRNGDTGRGTGGTTATARCSTTCDRSEAR